MAGATRRLLFFSRVRRSFERVFAASPLSLAPDETTMLRRLLQYNNYCPSVGDILVTIQRRKEAKTDREPGYLFAICGRKREPRY